MGNALHSLLNKLNSDNIVHVAQSLFERFDTDRRGYLAHDQAMKVFSACAQVGGYRIDDLDKLWWNYYVTDYDLMTWEEMVYFLDLYVHGKVELDYEVMGTFWKKRPRQKPSIGIIDLNPGEDNEEKIRLALESMADYVYYYRCDECRTDINPGDKRYHNWLVFCLIFLTS